MYIPVAIYELMISSNLSDFFFNRKKPSIGGALVRFRDSVSEYAFLKLWVASHRWEPGIFVVGRDGLGVIFNGIAYRTTN